MSRYSYDLSEYHCLCDLGRHKEPPLSRLDHEIACMTSVAGEAASSTQNIFQTFLSNRWTNKHQNRVSYLSLDCLGIVRHEFLKKGH